MLPSHSFVVLAYGHSDHLEECLRSLAAQTAPSPVVISTSTPFAGIAQVAERFGARLHLHGPNRGIGPDWNAALEATNCDLVTLVHQDDLYFPEFAAQTIEAFVAQPDTSFAFCDSGEVRDDGSPRPLAWNHRIKHWLVTMATWPTGRIDSSLRRRILLGFGNPIICASVTLNRRQRPDFRFREYLHTNMDWLAWLQLSARHPVQRIRRRLVDRRVHNNSATSQCISNGTRLVEDRLVFRQLWPRPAAAVISYAYRLSYSGYDR